MVWDLPGGAVPVLAEAVVEEVGVLAGWEAPVPEPAPAAAVSALTAEQECLIRQAHLATT